MTAFAADDRKRRDIDATREGIRQLWRALPRTPVVDRAKGMLVEQHGCSDDEPVADTTSDHTAVDVDSVLAGALARDQRAERRDRNAETRDRTAEHRGAGDPEGVGDAAADRAQAAIDRIHAAADRDASAADLAELLRWREALRADGTASGAPRRRTTSPDRPDA